MNESLFMQVEGITGGSQETNHVGWIELDSANITVITPSVQHGGGLGGGKASIDGIPIAMKGEKHSAELLKAVGMGTQFPKITIECLKTTGEATMGKFWVLEVTVGRFQNLSISSSAGVIYESCNIVGNIYKLEFFAQNDKGILASTGSIQYDSKKQEWS